MDRIPTPHLLLAYRALHDWAVYSCDRSDRRDRRASVAAGTKLAQIHNELTARKVRVPC